MKNENTILIPMLLKIIEPAGFEIASSTDNTILVKNNILSIKICMQ